MSVRTTTTPAVRGDRFEAVRSPSGEGWDLTNADNEHLWIATADIEELLEVVHRMHWVHDGDEFAKHVLVEAREPVTNGDVVLAEQVRNPLTHPKVGDRWQASSHSGGGRYDVAGLDPVVVRWDVAGLAPVGAVAVFAQWAEGDTFLGNVIPCEGVTS